MDSEQPKLNAWWFWLSTNHYSLARYYPREDEGVEHHDEADDCGEDDAVLEDGLEDRGFVTRLMRGGTRDDD